MSLGTTSAKSPQGIQHRQETKTPSRIIGSKIQVAGWTVYSALIWALKLSMLAFYVRLTVCHLYDTLNYAPGP